MSTDKRHKGILQAWVICVKRTMRRILSPACRLEMKPTWSPCIRDPMMGLIRKARILASSLMLRLRRDMGRLFDQEELSVWFGSIVMVTVSVSGPLSIALQALVNMGAKKSANCI